MANKKEKLKKLIDDKKKRLYYPFYLNANSSFCNIYLENQNSLIYFISYSNFVIFSHSKNVYQLL